MAACAQIEARAAAERTSRIRRLDRSPLVALCALVLLLALLNGIGAGLVRNSTYISGWVGGLLLAGMSLRSLRWAECEGKDLRVRVLRTHLGWLCVLALLFVAHVGLRLPHGGLDRAIFVLFLGLPVSALIGMRHTSRDSSKSFANWLAVHVALTFSLTSLVVFHGVFTHAHGVLAHWRGSLGG